MKVCPYCAEEIQAEARKCKHCGEWLDTSRAEEENDVQDPHIIDVEAHPRALDSENFSDSPLPKESGQEQPSLSQYEGVSGWLALLCLGLIFLSPLVGFGRIEQSYEEAKPAFENLPVVKTIADIERFIAYGFLFFGFCAGVALAMRERAGVTLAKAYFLSQLAYGVVLQYLIYRVLLNDQLFAIAAQAAVPVSIQSVVSFSIWYTYLCRSKRVQATYFGTAAPPVVVNTSQNDLMTSGINPVADVALQPPARRTKYFLFVCLVLSISVVGGFAGIYINSQSSLREKGATESERPQTWPSVFTRSSPTFDAPPQFPKHILSEADYKSMAAAYSYMDAQKFTIDRICETYPEVQEEATFTHMMLRNKFDSSVQGIENFLLENSLKPAMDSALEEAKLMLMEQQFALADAKEYIADVKKRAEGEIPENILEMLLLFNEDFRACPALEMKAGFATEFRSPRDSRSKGLEIGIKVPRSWQSYEPRRPNLVQRFQSCGGRGGVQLVIACETDESMVIDELEYVASDEVAEILAASFADASHIKEVVVAEVGESRLAGERCVWFEANAKADMLGNARDAKILCFAMQYEKVLVILQFFVVGEATNEDSVTTYNRYALAFQTIVGTFDIFNRYS